MGPQLFVNSNYNFVGWRHVMLGFSAAVFAVCLASIALVGLNLGVEFTGGAQIEVDFDERKPFAQPVNIESVRGALDEAGVRGATIVTIGSEDDHAFLIRLRLGTQVEELEVRLRDALVAKYGADRVESFDLDRESVDRASFRLAGEAPSTDDVRAVLESANLGIPIDQVSVDEASGTVVIRFENSATDALAALDARFGKDSYASSVDAIGAAVSRDLTRNALLAIAGACLLIGVYVWLRFDLEFAPGVVLSLTSNAIFVVGVWSLGYAAGIEHLEFTLTIVAAVLAVIGYSVNDTVVIYDRIRENREKFSGKDIFWVVNKATNETLSRTLLTAGGTLMATAAIGVLGSESIRWFGWAMFIGVLWGTWTTIAVAMPVTVLVEQYRSRNAVATSEPPGVRAKG